MELSSATYSADTVQVGSVQHLTSENILSDEAAVIVQWLVFVLCQLVDVLGSCTNIINIVCFVRQGLQDPVNVSLLGLAVADLGCLTTLLWTNICINPSFMSADLPFEPGEVQHLTSGYLHCTFTRVSAWLTALITLERCLCISLPLQVKSVVTPRRVSTIIVCVFIILLSSSAPSYVVNRLGMKFFPSRNKTLLGLVYTQDRETVETVSYAINNVFVPFTAFMIITACTGTLVITLRRKSEWRRASSGTAQADRVSVRNQKVAKMVTMISSLFIACFLPLSVLFMAASLEPELSVDGKYFQLLFLAGGFALLVESVNSSVNIVIYYHMSSKYRTVLREMFGLEGEDLTKKVSS